METKHTKGEWTTEECSNGGLIVCLGDSKDWGSQRVQIVNETNAKLIAAAPKLLEALMEFVTMYKQAHDSGDWGNWDLNEDKEYINALKAINKATK